MDQRINLAPDELLHIAAEFTKANQNGQEILNKLKLMIEQSDGQWEGERQKEFLSRINQSMTALSEYLRGLQQTSASLQQTADRFRQADQSR